MRGPSVQQPISFADADAVLRAQNFSGHLGAALTEFGSGRATLEIEVVDIHRQQFGLVAGGVWAYAADNDITFAAGSVLGARVVTAGLTIEYLRALRTGVVRASAHVVHSDDQLAVCTARLEAIDTTGAAKLCAVAQGRVLRTHRR